jgi:heme/copper-type cytochrome/quinol oxidase subunit 3
MSAAPLPVTATLPWDDGRGTAAMYLFIASEALLFVTLFFAYFYMGRDQPRWPPEPPKLTFALPMLAVLLLSSVVLHWGEKGLRTARRRVKPALAATIALGILFLVLQGLEYRDHLQTLRPTTNSYGSVFYTITSLHGLHLLAGLLMLGWVALLPRLEPSERPPYRPLHNASLYWHFVDTVWVLIVALLYVLPRLR